MTTADERDDRDAAPSAEGSAAIRGSTLLVAGRFLIVRATGKCDQNKRHHDGVDQATGELQLLG